MVVVGIENPAQNDASGPRHARVTLTRYLHDLGSPFGYVRLFLIISKPPSHWHMILCHFENRMLATQHTAHSAHPAEYSTIEVGGLITGGTGRGGSTPPAPGSRDLTPRGSHTD